MKPQRDIEAIHLFQKRLARILKSRLAYRLSQETLSVEIWKRPSGKFEVVFPSVDDDDLDAFLFNYRLLQQNNDPISFQRISESLLRLEVTKECRSKFEETRTRLNTFLDSRRINSIRGFPRTNRDLLNTFLYGQYSHHVERHYERLKEVKRADPDGSLDLQFVSLLQRLVSFLYEFLSSAAEIEIELKSRHED